MAAENDARERPDGPEAPPHADETAASERPGPPHGCEGYSLDVLLLLED
jgi:hypothetical protein